jgi:hypothetical protein
MGDRDENRSNEVRTALGDLREGDRVSLVIAPKTGEYDALTGTVTDGTPGSRASVYFDSFPGWIDLSAVSRPVHPEGEIAAHASSAAIDGPGRVTLSFPAFDGGAVPVFALIDER